MIGFRGKLRRFVSNWVSMGEPPASAAPLSFIFNADDTPRLWSEDAAACWPPPSPSPAAPEKPFPRFANMATHEGARLAA